MSRNAPDQLNICLVAYRFPILGRINDQGFLWPLAKGLAARGHHVTVISAKSPLGKSEIVRDGVRVFYLHEGFPNLSHLKFEDAVYQKFSELHKISKFDIVHSIDQSAFKIGKNKKFLDVTISYDVQATQMAQIFSIIGMTQESVKSLLTTSLALTYKFLTTYFGGDRELLSTADGIFVTSPQQRIFLERYYLYPDFHTYTVPYGVEIGSLSPRPEALELRSKYKLSDMAHLVLTISDMAEAEEVVNLLRAFERVAVKKPNSFMVIIGNGPAWKEIEYEMLQLALGSRVIMTGALTPDEIGDWLSISEVYVNISSKTSGFEPAMIEAMAQKKIIIGSEVSPIANIVEDGLDGFLIRPADIDSLSHLVIEIFSGSLPAEEIGQRARDKVINLFDTKKMIQTLEDAYKKILVRQ